MIKTRAFVAALAFAGMAAAAHADVTFTPTVVSDYDFRGITQSANDPALQLSFDYASGPLHLGLWTSNIHFDPTEKDFKFFGSKWTEVDFIGDFSGGDDKTVKYNVGFVDYTYPGQSGADYPEIWGTLSKAWASGTLHYSWDYGGLGSNSQAYYLELNGNWSIGDSGFGILAHAGHSWGDYWDNPIVANGSYQDYALGVTKSYGHFNGTLKYIDTSSYYDQNGLDKKPFNGFPNDKAFSGKGKVVLMISTTFPWAPPGK
jgi:uncharacterized protein (TIGR02001 family)